MPRQSTSTLISAPSPFSSSATEPWVSLPTFLALAYRNHVLTLYVLFYLEGLHQELIVPRPVVKTEGVDDVKEEEDKVSFPLHPKIAVPLFLPLPHPPPIPLPFLSTQKKKREKKTSQIQANHNPSHTEAHQA